MMRQVLLLHLILTLCLCPPLRAEEKKKASAKNFFSDVFDDQKTIWSSPFQKTSWEEKQTYIFLGVSGASFALDGEPSRKLRENEHLVDFNRVFASDAADVILFAIPFAMLAVGELTNKEDFSQYGWKVSRAALDAFLVSTLIKVGTLRERPHTGKVYGFWEGGNSFPSGHSTYAWAIASVTAKHFSYVKWVPWVVYPAAGLISFSRVSSGNHFASDAVTGSAIGFMIGHFVIE